MNRTFLMFVISIFLSSGISSCGGGSGGSSSTPAPDPAESSEWGLMEWGKGTWGS